MYLLENDFLLIQVHKSLPYRQIFIRGQYNKRIKNGGELNNDTSSKIKITDECEQ